MVGWGRRLPWEQHTTSPMRVRFVQTLGLEHVGVNGSRRTLTSRRQTRAGYSDV